MIKVAYIFITLLVIYLIVCLILYLFQEKLIFFPQKLERDYTYRFHSSFEEVFIPTTDGAEINALLFKAAEPEGVILYFHGNAGNLAGWGFVAENFTRYNYDVFIMDYRGFGKSTGKLSEAALQDDAIACYNFLVEDYAQESIIIYGRSIGSGVAVKLAAQVNPQLLMLESPFYHLADMAHHYLPFLPHQLLLKYTFRSDLHIKKVEAPVYILHGDEDEVVPYESGVKLFQSIPEDQVQMFTIKGGGHNNLDSFEEYDRALMKILQ